MTTQLYLIDTNIIIGLEDNHTFQPAYANFSKLAAAVRPVSSQWSPHMPEMSGAGLAIAPRSQLPQHR